MTIQDSINEAVQHFINKVQPEFEGHVYRVGSHDFWEDTPVVVDEDWAFILDGYRTLIFYRGWEYGYLRDSGDYWFDDFNEGNPVTEFVAALHKAADNARVPEGQLRLPL